MKPSGGETKQEGWDTISSETRFHDAHLGVVDEEVRTPARPNSQRWLVVRRKAAVVIAPVTAEGKLVLIRQERVPIRATIWEVPAGQIDAEGELDAVALRELREETGYQLAAGGELLALGHFFSSPGFTDERGYFFLASPVEPAAAGHAHEDSESIVDCRAFSPREIAGMIAADEIRDANTLSICAKLVARGLFALDP